MSSMPFKFPRHTLFNRPIAIVALAMASVGALSTPSSAERQSNASPAQFSQQSINQAIDRWEYLNKTRGLSFAQYANFAARYPEFPRMEIIRLRAEAGLKNEAPSPSSLIYYFDKHPPLTNQGRAAYALALASQQRPQAADMARAAWRGGEMSDSAEAYIKGMFGSQLTTDDNIARVDALLWQGERDAATRMLNTLPQTQREIAMARLALLNGSMPSSAGKPSCPTDRTTSSTGTSSPRTIGRACELRT